MTYKIFIDGEPIPLRYLEGSSSYLYQKGYIRIFNRGRLVHFQEARKGDAFVVVCTKGKAYLERMVPPNGNGALVAWLLGFNKDNRATNIVDYKRKLACERQRRFWDGYKEREYKSYGYVFTLCNSPRDDNTRNVAGFVSDAVTKEEVIRLIPLMEHHADWYILGLLTERFGVTEEEFRHARKQ